ncbi:MAG: hypothetical protein ACLFUU_03160 [Desulfobacteraceae bacterium]
MESLQDSVLFRLQQELKEAAAKCPNCQGAREYPFISRGRENLVPCARCEPIYRLLEPLEVALEMIRDEGKHAY